MRVIECRAYGPPEDLVVAERERPEPGPGAVRVRVEAAGVNFVDALFVAGAYQVRIPPPFVPGNEIAGTVEALGEGVETVAVGDRVMAQLGVGAFAEAVLVPAERLARIPDGVESRPAAAFQLTYATALYALRERGALRPGETVLVLAAAGGVGSAAVDVAKAMGARVIAAAAGADKLATARALGADETVDYQREDLKTRVRELTDGRGADLVVDPVGGPYSEPAVRATAWEGRFLVIGFAAGEIPRIPLNLALLRGCSIVGVDWGALSRARPAETRPVTETLAAWLGEGRIRPHVSRTRVSRSGDSQCLRESSRRLIKARSRRRTGSSSSGRNAEQVPRRPRPPGVRQWPPGCVVVRRRFPESTPHDALPGSHCRTQTLRITRTGHSPLAEAGAALRAVLDRQVHGKAVLVPGD